MITLFSINIAELFHAITCSFYNENSGSQHRYIYSFAQSHKTHNAVSDYYTHVTINKKLTN